MKNLTMIMMICAFSIDCCKKTWSFILKGLSYLPSYSTLKVKNNDDIMYIIMVLRQICASVPCHDTKVHVPFQKQCLIKGDFVMRTFRMTTSLRVNLTNLEARQSNINICRVTTDLIFNLI